MKKLLIFSLIILLLFAVLSTPGQIQAIVADHTVISQFSSIPRTTIEAAQAKKLLFYHQSTGNNIQYYGLNCLAGTENDTAIRPECQTYINNRINNTWPYYAYPNWSWLLWPQPMADAEGKINQFVNLVNQQMTQDPNRYQIFGMKFCYVDGYNLDFNNFRTRMENLESTYPNKTFIWATDVLNTTNHINNPTIQAFNNAVRNYIATHPNKFLLDLADIESKGGICRDSNNYEILCPDYFNDAGGDAGGHPDIDGSIAMSKGLWWLMANLAGTVPTPISSPTPSTSPTPTLVSSPTPTRTPSTTPTSTPTTTPPAGGKPGDANADGKVDGIDYVIWLNHYGQQTTSGYAVGDFNLDQKIDGIDYVIWLNHYGT